MPRAKDDLDRHITGNYDYDQPDAAWGGWMTDKEQDDG